MKVTERQKIPKSAHRTRPICGPRSRKPAHCTLQYKSKLSAKVKKVLGGRPHIMSVLSRHIF